MLDDGLDYHVSQSDEDERYYVVGDGLIGSYVSGYREVISGPYDSYEDAYEALQRYLFENERG